VTSRRSTPVSTPIGRWSTSPNEPATPAGPNRRFFIRDATGRLFQNSLSDAWKATRYLTVNAGLAYTLAISDSNAGKGSLRPWGR
jgi:hypothetical protein